MRMAADWRSLFSILLTATVVCGGPWPLYAETPPEDLEFFEGKIRPVLVNHCVECHGAGQAKGNLRLDSLATLLKGGDSGPAVVPGKPAESLLIEAVGHLGDIKMPPKERLSNDEIADLSKWIEKGAPWPEGQPVAASSAGERFVITDEQRAFWSFQPLRLVPPPQVRQAEWPQGEIDRFILAQLETEGLAPSPVADRRTLIRRATFDMLGLPPTPQEVAAFLADESPTAYEALVDRLLASPHYGERWGRYWLDVARYAEDQAHTFEARTYPQGFRYRDWVVKSLNEDLPYDQFVMQQIAGDLLEGAAEGAYDRQIALGYFALGPVYYADAGCAFKASLDELDDRLDTLARGFLGLTLACARCHDHKFDPISQKDYYALAGVFKSTAYREVPLVPAEVVAAYDEGQQKIKAQGESINGFLKSERKRLNSLIPPKGLALIPKDKVEGLLGEESQQKLGALRKQLEELKQQAPPKYPFAHALGDGESANMKVHLRGNPNRTGDEVPRRFLEVLSPESSPPAFQNGSGRLELARAIASERNPLTARVIVNRLWQQHFGRGIVATPSNFGALGERPTHPELLDYLARRLMEQRWSLKAIHREILLSATYRQSSQQSDAGLATDPENRLLSRMPRRRLDVEAWRDSLLAVSGRLDPTVGGPSAALGSAEFRRRTLYAQVSRHNLAGLLRLFDFPDPNITSERRTTTTVPLQQLFVLNSEFMVQQARAFANRLQNSSGDDAARIREAYRWLYGREAADEEVALGLGFLEQTIAASAEKPPADAEPLSAWEQYAQILLSANEFTFVD